MIIIIISKIMKVFQKIFNSSDYVKCLVEVGYKEKDAREALAVTGNDVYKALGLLQVCCLCGSGVASVDNDYSYNT